MYIEHLKLLELNVSWNNQIKLDDKRIDIRYNRKD